MQIFRTNNSGIHDNNIQKIGSFPSLTQIAASLACVCLWPCWVAVIEKKLISIVVLGLNYPFWCFVTLFLNCRVSYHMWILFYLQELVGSRSTSYLLDRALCSSFELAASGCWWMAPYRTDAENIHCRIHTQYAKKPPSCGMIIVFPMIFIFWGARFQNWDWILMDSPAQATIFWSFSSNDERCVSWICKRSK